MPRPPRKSEVIDAATELFASQGYASATVREVAERSGMLSGSIYAHFPSKEHLLYESISRAFDEATSLVAPIIESDLPAADKLGAALAAHIDLLDRRNLKVVD